LGGGVEISAGARDNRNAGIVVGEARRGDQSHAAAASDHDRCPVAHRFGRAYQKAYDRYYSSKRRWRRGCVTADQPATTGGFETIGREASNVMEVPAVAKPATAEKRQRRERGSINPDDIISGAFDLAEQVSIDNLSMPLLGKHLGVGVTSIYWYFRKKDDLLNAMTDRALGKYVFATPYVEATDWRETLANHARSMRKTFMGNPILCDLILIRSALSPRAARLGVQEIEKAIAGLAEAGLSPEEAFDTYSAVSVHVRGSVVLHRLQEKNQATENGGRTIEDAMVIDAEATPLLAQMTTKGHHIGAADDNNFEYGLDCILDHAARLIEQGSKSTGRQRKSTSPRQRKSPR
jgi:AcrR family transcriptional regulator